jgi:hypothetical protein
MGGRSEGRDIEFCLFCISTSSVINICINYSYTQVVCVVGPGYYMHYS